MWHKQVPPPTLHCADSMAKHCVCREQCTVEGFVDPYTHYYISLVQDTGTVVRELLFLVAMHASGSLSLVNKCSSLYWIHVHQQSRQEHFSQPNNFSTDLTQQFTVYFYGVG